MRNILLIGLLLPFLSQSQTYINENFNSGSIPAGWTVVDGCASCATTWDYVGAGGWDPFNIGTSWYVDSPTQFMVIKSASSTQQNNDELVSPVFNSSGAGTITLKFDQVYEDQSTPGMDQGHVEVYDGSTWQSVAVFDSDLGSFSGGTNNSQSIDISAYANTSMQVRFRYVNNGLSSLWWGVDNVVVEYTAGVNPPVADFTVNDVTLCAGDIVDFTDLSSYGPTSWSWSISPTTGVTFITSSTSQNPQVSFDSAGTYSVTLTATNSNGSDSETKTGYITVDPQPIVYAGPDQEWCETVGSVSLAGSFSVASGALWSTSGDGVFTPSPTDSNATYTFGSADIANGGATLFFTTTGNGNCSAVSDNMTLIITPTPIVNAGPDQTICASTSSLALNGSVSYATGLEWTTSGDGSFTPNTTDTNITYVFGSADVVNGVVFIYATSTGNSSCVPMTDTVAINLDEEVTANITAASSDICSNETASLSVALTGTNSGSWSGGGGFFTPDSDSLNVTYAPNSNDLNNGQAVLIFTANSFTTCAADADTIIIGVSDCNGTSGFTLLNTELNTSVSPNPMTKGGMVLLESKETLNSIHVYEITGKEIMDIDNVIENSIQVDCSSLDAGVYLFKIETNSQIVTRRLVVKE